MVTNSPQAAQAAQTEKLQAFLAHAGVASRRQAELLISQGLVTVNGQPAHLGQRITPQQDVVHVRHQLVAATDVSQYILINKPEGVISTTQDELQRQTVLDLLPDHLRSHRLYPVGRLDQDSQGLVLLTNDGELAHRLTHPSFEIPKTYQVQLDRPPSDKALEHLRRGVKLTDGFTHPSVVELLPAKGPEWLEIILYEGRNRQVRRMMERVGYHVVRLVRTQLGPFNLDQLGHQPYRLLDTKTVTQAKQAIGLEQS